MEKKVNKSIVYMIGGIVVLVLAIAGSAYAYYSASATGEIVGTAAGAGLELTVTKLSTSANGGLIPLDNDITTLTKAAKGYGNSTSTFDATKSCIDKNGYSVCQIYKVTISNTSTVPITVNGGVTLFGTNTPYIACAKMEDNITVTNNGSCTGSRTLADNYVLNTGSSNDYYIIVYIKNIDKEQTDVGVFNGTITFTSTQGQELKARFGATNAAETMEELFNPNTTVLNNNITYQYDTVNNLMEDNHGNIRYYGAGPNNYVYFNCEEYPETNCELWRIIGVFDGKLKLIRNELIGNYSWDTSASEVNGGMGINQWGESGDYGGADLMKLLNPGYEGNQDLDSEGNTITVSNSLYWNSGSGTCYNGTGNATTTCDFTGIGLKNSVTKDMIVNTIWNIGGNKYNDLYSNQIYEIERGENVAVPGTTCSGVSCNDTVTRTTSWTGKIGLMYPSDYGYATDFTKCSQDLYNYKSNIDSYACRSNDWLYNSAYQSLLAPHSRFSYFLWSVYSNGQIYYINFNSTARGIRPVLYLKPELVIESGSGTRENPYVIS